MIRSGIQKLSKMVKNIIWPNETVALGRWTRDHGKKSMIKIDLANTDHCGTCAQEPKKLE